MSGRLAILFLIPVLLAGSLSAQDRRVRELPRPQETVQSGVGWEIFEGDTITSVTMMPIPVFAKKKDFRNYQRLVRNVKKVYPYAEDAKEYLDYLEEELPKLKNDKERQKFTKQVEKEIVKKYTPVLENMTRSEGKVLIKLIYRQTDNTAYKMLKDFRGGFSAGFWNTIARLFKANLKDTYDPEGEDYMMEQIVKYYEAGLL